MLIPTWQAEGVELYLGDCLDILPQLESSSFSAVVTDPPYGIGWSRGENKARSSMAHNGIEGDRDTSLRDRVLEMWADMPAVVFGSFYAPFPARLKQVLVWYKPADSGLVGCVTGFRRDAEPIFLVGPWPVRTVAWSSVLQSVNGQSKTTTETGYPHTKPVDLVKRLIDACPNGAILDPFMGSGTTGVACVQTGRRFIGIEISEQYFDISVKRIEQAQAQLRLF